MSERRIASLDVVRGAVMVLMAIDHVRVFSGVPAGGPTPGVFFTRWITHFCAPAFVFLAGTSAFLHGRTLAGRGALSRYLLLRGLWLILLELTFLRFAWTFNFDYAHYALAGVIWVIGWSLIALAALVFLPLPALAAFGIAIVAGHNFLSAWLPQPAHGPPAGGFDWILRLVYFGGGIPVGEGELVVLYSLVPWIGVIAAGYAFGAVMTMDRERRRRICLGLGVSMIGAFVLLRAFNLYGDPRPWDGSGALSFLNTTKYPASLLFLLMTLGPVIAIVPALERADDRVSRALIVFGRTPLLYYLLHIPLIHLAACAVSLARSGQVVPWLFENHPMRNGPPPDGYTWGLGLLYLVTAVVVVLLYFPCRWFGERRMKRREAWMSLL
ncbi:MAG: DUF1624 domain-containing protein [Acidobacteria bacterium]|nr:DUF1624 domain-containing protein [Acidobacteriota bacterium]